MTLLRRTPRASTSINPPQRRSSGLASPAWVKLHEFRDERLDAHGFGGHYACAAFAAAWSVCLVLAHTVTSPATAVMVAAIFGP